MESFRIRIASVYNSFYKVQSTVAHCRIEVGQDGKCVRGNGVPIWNLKCGV